MPSVGDPAASAGLPARKSSPVRSVPRGRFVALSAAALMLVGAAGATSAAAVGSDPSTPTTQPAATSTLPAVEVPIRTTPAAIATTARVVTPTPPGAPTPTVTGTPSSTPAPAPIGAGDVPPTFTERPTGAAVPDAEVQRRVALAQRLRQNLLITDIRVLAATTRVTLLSGQAAAALQQLREAREAQSAARTEMLRQLRRLTALRGQVEDSQADLGRWARESYAAGGPMASYEGLITAFQGRSTDDVAHDLAVLEHVGLVGSLALDRIEVATAAQQDAARRAATAATRAAAARVTADAARTRADSLLLEQRTALAALQVQQIRATGAVALTRQDLMSSGAAAAFVAEAQLAETLRARAGGASIALDPGECQGLDTSTYPNGEIPGAAFCPVWGAPGHLLRADAAAGLRAVSRAFALQFGTPICVGSSYRTRSAQVAVFAAKPQLAAVPGTSNHGWGTALDLCGGIQSFGSAEHVWLLANAPLHGWFHPAWAGPGGSKPEPWHWEFAG